MTEAQKKAAAWKQVGELCAKALALLVEANEGPCEQAKLDWIADKAKVQAKLWT